MYKRIFSGGELSNDVQETEKDIVRAINEYKEIFFQDFDSKEDAIAFINKFPKYIKLKLWEVNNGDNIWVGFVISNLTLVTGEINEEGEKRIKGLVKYLKKLGYIQ